MKYKTYVVNITKALAEYKKIIDRLEISYIEEKQKILEAAMEMQGKWTEEYIEQYKKENNPIVKYKKQMQEARAGYEPKVLYYLDMIKKQLDNYFNAPVKAEFANKINTIKISGLKLSNLEFELLQETATSYMECRLLNQLAESRTKTEIKHIYDAEHPDGGKNGVLNVETPDPFIYLELPNIDRIYKEFKEYRTAAKGLLYNYAGSTAKLSEALEDGTPDYIAINMDSYFRGKYEESFLRTMEQANAILPESKIKRELTENDKKLIDVLVDPKYPALAKESVKRIAENSPELAELFALDERYAKYLDIEE